MRRYVLDSCVALKWLLPEPDSGLAIRIRDQFQQGIIELLAPDVFPIELGHALSRAEPTNRIQPPQGATHLANLLQILPDLHASLPLLPRAFQIASQARIGLYDCLFVALADREGCELITADARLKNNLKLPYIIDMGAVQ